MGRREQLSLLRNRITQIEEERKELFHRQEDIEEQMEKVVLEIATEEGLFRESKWEYSFFSSATGRVQLDSRTAGHKRLAELMQKDYHYGTSLDETGTNIRFDDNDVSLSFPDMNIAAEFIRKHGLQINAPKIEQEQQECAKRLEQLNEHVRIVKELTKRA